MEPGAFSRLATSPTHIFVAGLVAVVLEERDTTSSGLVLGTRFVDVWPSISIASASSLPGIGPVPRVALSSAPMTFRLDRSIHFTVYGTPAPQGSMRAFHHRSTGRMVHLPDTKSCSNSNRPSPST